MDEELNILFEPFEAAAMVGDCADALPRAQSLEQDARPVVRAAIARLLGTTLVASLPSFWADASPQLPPELPAASALLEKLLDDTDSDVAVAAALAASSAYRAGVTRAAAAAAVAISAGPSDAIEAQRELWASLVQLKEVLARRAMGSDAEAATPTSKGLARAAALRACEVILVAEAHAAASLAGGKPPNPGGNKSGLVDRPSLLASAEATVKGLGAWLLDAPSSRTGETTRSKSAKAAGKAKGSSSSTANTTTPPTAAELCCGVAGLASAALSSPTLYPKAAEALQALLVASSSSSSWPAHLEPRSLTGESDQTGEGEVKENEEEQKACAAVYEAQAASVRATLRNQSMLVVRKGRVGVGALRLTPVQEQERFRHADALGALLAGQGLAEPVKKAIPGGHMAQQPALLIGQTMAASTATAAGGGRNRRGSGGVTPPLSSGGSSSGSSGGSKHASDPRRKRSGGGSGDPRRPQGAQAAAAAAVAAAEPLAGGACGFAVALTPDQAASMAQEATVRILSSSQGGAKTTAATTTGSANGSDAAAPSSVEAQEFAQSKRTCRGLALELGPSSALREALAAKLELLADGLPVGLQLNHRNFTAGANGRLMLVEGQQQLPSLLPSSLLGATGGVSNLKACLRMVEFCCADLAARGEQLLALLWALYAHEAPHRAKLARMQADAIESLKSSDAASARAPTPVASWSNGHLDEDDDDDEFDSSGASSLLRGPSAYDKVFLEVLLIAQSGPHPRSQQHQQQQQQQAPPRRSFRPLHKVLLEAPALPDGACAAVARRCVLNPYGSRSNAVAASPQALKTGLNVLKVVALERSGPQGPRLAALDAALQLACTGPHSPLLRIDEGDGNGDDDDDEIEGAVVAPLAAAAASSPSGLERQLSNGSTGSGGGGGSSAEDQLFETKCQSVRKQAVNLLVRYMWPTMDLAPLVEHRALAMLQRCADAVAAEASRKQRGALLLQLRARDRADKAALERAASEETAAKATSNLENTENDDAAPMDEFGEPLDATGDENTPNDDDDDDNDEVDEPLPALEAAVALPTPSRVVRSNSISGGFASSSSADPSTPGGTSTSLLSQTSAAAMPEPSGPSATARLFTFPALTPAAAAAVRAQAQATAAAAAAAATASSTLVASGGGPVPPPVPPPRPPPVPPPKKKAKSSSWGKARGSAATATAEGADNDDDDKNDSGGTPTGGLARGVSAGSTSSAAAAAAAAVVQHRALDGATGRRLLELPAALSGHVAPVLQKLVAVYAAAAPVAAATDAALAAAQAADAQVAAREAADRAVARSGLSLAAEVGGEGDGNADAISGGAAAAAWGEDDDDEWGEGDEAMEEWSAEAGGAPAVVTSPNTSSTNREDAAVAAARALLPAGGGIVVSTLSSALPRIIKFAALKFGKPGVVSLMGAAVTADLKLQGGGGSQVEHSPDTGAATGGAPSVASQQAANGIVFKALEILAASETLNPGLPNAVALLRAAAALDVQRGVPDIRHQVPFLGACDRATMLALLPRLLPWTKPDLDAATEAGTLPALLASAGVSDHQPLGCAEFERAVRYRCNAAGKVGTEAHAAAASELVELVVRHGSTLEQSGNANAGLVHVRRCVFAGLEVLCRTDAVGAASLGKCVVKLADEKPHPPLLLLRLVHECARQRPALAQLVCTQVMPLLVRNGIWLERARWQGFLLLAKRYLGPRPPHALSALLSLPPQPLQQLCTLVPAAKPALAAYAQQQQQSMSIGHGPSALGGGLHPETRRILGI